jgi:hypothetical protein
MGQTDGRIGRKIIIEEHETRTSKLSRTKSNNRERQLGEHKG